MMLSPEEARTAATEAGLPPMLAEFAFFRTVLVSPGSAVGIGALSMALRSPGGPVPRVRELMALRAAWQAQSAYVWGQHFPGAARAGVTEEDLCAIRRGDIEALPGWVAQVAMQILEDLQDGGCITDPVWSRIAPGPNADAAEESAARDAAQTCAAVRLVAAAAVYRMLTTVTESLRIPLAAGERAWPPDQIAP